jgi:hypothetical protein
MKEILIQRFAMRRAYCFAICTLVTACGGGGSHDSPAPPPAPTIALTATAPAAMRNGASVEIRTTLTGLTGPVTWSLEPASGTLSDFYDNQIASYSPYSLAPSAAPEKVTITASAGGVSQSIQLDLKPTPTPVAYLELPKVWTVDGLIEAGILIKGGTVASAADRSGNLYLAYSAPVSEIKKVGTDGSITTLAHVGHPYSLAFGPNGMLYVVDQVGQGTYAIRLIAPDGTMSTLTQTAPFEEAKGPVDGPTGVATALEPLIAVSPAGTVYATDSTRIRKIAPDGSFSTFANGPTGAPFISLSRIAIDAAENLYVVDRSRVFKVTPAGEVSNLAGWVVPDIDSFDMGKVDGTGSAAHFNHIQAMTIDPAGNLYVLDDHLLRKITGSGVVSTVATGLGMTPFTAGTEIKSLYAGLPGVVVLQSSASLSKVAVD